MMLGLELAGFRTLAANEIHPHPCMTLRANFPGTPIIEAPVQDLSLSSLSAHLGADLSDVDLIAGGPPCQGFSTAGMKDPVDPRNLLIGEFIRLVNQIRPKFFLLENVTGLQTMHQGRLFANVLHEISLTGYSFRHAVLFAADFGVPQMRKRIIILGSRDGAPPALPRKTHGSSKEATLFEDDLKPYVGCGDAIGDLPAIAPGEVATEYEIAPQTEFQFLMRQGSDRIHNHEASRHRRETQEYYALVPPGGNWLDIPKELRNLKEGIQRWPLDGLSRTITTEPTDFVHPTLNRIPTVRETARIQTFPDWYRFCGQRTTGNKMRRLGYCSQTQQVGNAVPPFLARAIGLAIIPRCLVSGLPQIDAASERLEFASAQSGALRQAVP